MKGIAPKITLAILITLGAWLSIGATRPLHTVYMLQHHRNGTTTVFEHCGPYFPEQ